MEKFSACLGPVSGLTCQQLIYQLTDSSLKLVKKIKAETSYKRRALLWLALVADITILMRL